METKNTATATPAITLSDAALKEVKRLINVQGLTEGGLRVDAKSAIYLHGTQLDFQKDLMSGSFKFVNPNAEKTCGCGESFSA